MASGLRVRALQSAGPVLVNVKTANNGTGAGVIKLILEERGELQTMELDRDAITIGRTADNAVRVADALSSRHHCKIEKTSEGWFVEDLKSRNGTTLNGQRIDGRRVLAVGDQVAIGESVIHFGAKLEKAKPAPPPKAKSQKVVKPAVGTASVASSGPAATGRKARFVLKGTEGARLGKASGIPGFPFTIGKKKGCGLIVEGEDVSNEHCMLVEDEGVVHVVDLNSEAGTFVSGKRVKGREKLPPNAILALGGATKFRFKDLAAKGGEAASDDELEAAEAPTTKLPPNAAMPAPVEEVKDLSKLGEDEDSDPAATPSKGIKRPSAKVEPPKEKSARKVKAAVAAASLEDVSLGGDETGIATSELSSAALEQGAGGGAGGAIAVILAVLALLGAAVPVAGAFLGREDRDPEPAENRVANWSFEQEPALRDWKAEGATSVVKDGVQYGTRAIKVEADGKSELRAAEPYRIPAGKALTLHGAVKTTGQAAAVLAIEWTDELAPSWKEVGYAAIVEGSTTWSDGGMTLAPPSRATHGRAIGFAAPLGGGTGAAFFDRIFLKEEEQKDAPPKLEGASLDVVATPRGALHLVRPGQNGAPATQLARVSLALAAADGSRGDPLSTQLGWTPVTPAGDPGDGGLFADGTILDTASGDRVSAGVVVKPVGDGFKIWWELAKKELADKRKVRLVLEVPQAKAISPVELQSRTGVTTSLDTAFTKGGASFIKLEGIIELALGSGGDQISIHMPANADLEVERVGDGLRFEIAGVPDVKGDLRVLGFGLAKASSLAAGRIRELLEQAQTARREGRLEEARQTYVRLAREFSHDKPVASRALRDAELLSTQADRLLEAVNAAAEDADELGLIELDKAAHAWAEALAKAFPGAPQLSKANASVARADERLAKSQNAAKGLRARDLVQRAIRHREAHRNSLARTIYEYVIATFPADDPNVKDAKERLAAMPPAGEGE